MTIPMQRVNNEMVSIGKLPTDEEWEALNRAAIKPDQILENLDGLNEEINDTYLPKDILPTVKQLSKKNQQELERKAMSPVSRPGPQNDKTIALRRKAQEAKNLDDELEELGAELDTKVTPAEVTDEDQTPDMRNQILKILSGIPGAPNKQQIEALKQKHGERAVHVMAFDENEAYIFTHLKRMQWKKIQELTAKAQQANNTDAEDTLKEKVVQYCVLWPTNLTIEFFINSRAGLIDSLFSVIMANSYFLTPQQAMLLTTQL